MTNIRGLCTFYFEERSDGGYWAVVEGAEGMRPDGGWSYEHLHILKTGDTLVIYHKNDPSLVVWQGDVILKHYEPLSQKVYEMWIHSDQEGIDREVWSMYFLEEWPAELTTQEN